MSSPRIARARWLLCALLWLALWGQRSPPPPACPSAHEAAAHPVATRAWSGVVRCGTGAGPEGAAVLRGPARSLFGQPLDPNRADIGTLQTLPGIGPARAQAWIEARERRPFCTVPELERVVGIGPRTLARISPRLAIQEAPGCAAALAEKPARP